MSFPTPPVFPSSVPQHSTTQRLGLRAVGSQSKLEVKVGEGVKGRLRDRLKEEETRLVKVFVMSKLLRRPGLPVLSEVLNSSRRRVLPIVHMRSL